MFASSVPFDVVRRFVVHVRAISPPPAGKRGAEKLREISRVLLRHTVYTDFLKFELPGFFPVSVDQVASWVWWTGLFPGGR